LPLIPQAISVRNFLQQQQPPPPPPQVWHRIVVLPP
jgi:hypothetical protein